jgi:AP-3 complex subunit mu
MTIEALYIFDQNSNNSLILSHVWTGRPPSAQTLLPLYLHDPKALTYSTSTNPPTLVHAISQDALLLLCASSNDIDPLLVLEFLHRVVDVFEHFLSSPLMPWNITSNYHVVAQLLAEMCDCGAIATTEPNALRDLVEAPSLINKILGGVGLPAASPSLSSASMVGPPSMSSMSSSNHAPAIPWRRSNVRHTSNELYVDIVETLHIITAPSGQPLSALAHGSIVFTAKVSGVPDLFLSLTSQAGGSSALPTTLNLPVFHPCVRLARWKERPGELSFVPPDGRFLLMGYEVDLLGGPDHLDRAMVSGMGKKKARNSLLHVPATVSVKTGLGSTGADFEVRLQLNPSFAARSGAARTDAFSKPTGFSTAKTAGTSAHPVVEELVVRVPVASGVRNLGDMKASRGDVRWAPGEDHLEWRVSAKEVSSLAANVHSSGALVVATLRCSIAASTDDDDDDEDGKDEDDVREAARDRWEYDENEGAAQAPPPKKFIGRSQSQSSPAEDVDARTKRRIQANRALMPTSASVSFQVKGWLASGLKVDKLALDTQRSRGLGAGVQPYKGVKYLTVSEDGVETRC